LSDPHDPPDPSCPDDVIGRVLPIVREINAVLDPETLLTDIARKLRQLIDFAFLGIYLAEPDGTLRAAHTEGYDRALGGEPARPGEGIVGIAAAERRTLFIPDVRQEPRYVPLTPGVVVELAIPLIHQAQMVGVLNIEGPDAAPFTPRMRNALQILADHLAVAIANATAHRQTRRYAELVTTLYEISLETGSILDLDQLLHHVAESVKKVIDYEMFGILLLDEERQELVLRQSVRFGQLPKKPRIPVGQGLCGTAAQTRQPVLVGDVSRDPRYLRLIPQTRSELVIPLIHRDRVVGVFDLESTELDRFREEHIQVLTPLAAQVASAIQNARLVEDLHAREARRVKELAIAQRVQQGLFPEETPCGDGWEAFASFLPARELGGDLYDFYPLDKRLLGLAVGDVSGKGVPAALYGAFASGAVRGRAFERHPPAELLGKVNRTLNRRAVEGFYCTLAYALFDFEARTVRLANSGLPYPLRFCAETGRCQRLEIAGLPLGVFPDARYEEQTVGLGSGDIFLFCSDGLVETRCGLDADVSCLEREIELHAHRPADQIGEAILSEVPAFTGRGSPPDDVTVVVVKVR
jgi:phosphoserine phosphatase RsbU/P